MKLLIRFSIVMLVLISVRTFAQNDMSNLKSTFQQLNEKWAKAMVADDIDGIINFYADDAVSMPPNMPVRTGKEGIRSAIDNDFKQGFKPLDFKTTTLNVWGSGDVAVEQGTYKVNLIPQGSTNQITDVGKYINVWQKQNDGSWKLKAEIWNSDQNPMQQAGAKEEQK